MNIVRNILGRIFAAWAMLVIVVTMILIFIPFLERLRLRLGLT